MKRYRVIKVKYLGATNTLGPRLKITEPARGYGDKDESIVFPSDNAFSSVYSQASDILERGGFNPIGKGNDIKHVYIFCDAWRDKNGNFPEIKDLKKLKI